MKILLVTPLYPPDIAQPAPYTKELASRLTSGATTSHGIVTIATYGSHPEKIPGVTILTTSKHRPLLVRIFLFTILLIRPILAADAIIFENGASVELPILLLSFFIHKRYIFQISDTRAHSTALKGTLRGKIEQLARSRARVVIPDMPLPRPEILPLDPYPTQEFEAYENSWRTHLELVLTACKK